MTLYLNAATGHVLLAVAAADYFRKHGVMPAWAVA